VTHPLAFRRCDRLVHAADFERVYRAGRRAGDGLFGVSAAPNQIGHARLGMSVSLRTTGNAVRRNRVRRLIREVFRLRRPALPSLDLVVTSRPGARVAPTVQIVGSLERLIEQLARQGAASA
jgi:ribonuclease P protein component